MNAAKWNNGADNMTFSFPVSALHLIRLSKSETDCVKYTQSKGTHCMAFNVDVAVAEDATQFGDYIHALANEVALIKSE